VYFFGIQIIASPTKQCFVRDAIICQWGFVWISYSLGIYYCFIHFFLFLHSIWQSLHFSFSFSYKTSPNIPTYKSSICMMSGDVWRFVSKKCIIPYKSKICTRCVTFFSKMYCYKSSTSLTFLGNVCYKSSIWCIHSKIPVLSDKSSICNY
jgi:hypothetical protein